MIVAHRSNIAAVTDVALEEDQGVVLRPDEDGGFAVLGAAMPDGW